LGESAHPSAVNAKASSAERITRLRPNASDKGPCTKLSERKYAVHVRLPARQDQQTLLDRGGGRHFWNDPGIPVGGRFDAVVMRTQVAF
jgi:hypothetical protein